MGVFSIEDFLSSTVGYLLYPGVVQSSSIFLSGFANRSGIWGHCSLLQWAILGNEHEVSFSPSDWLRCGQISIFASNTLLF